MSLLGRRNNGRPSPAAGGARMMMMNSLSCSRIQEHQTDDDGYHHHNNEDSGRLTWDGKKSISMSTDETETTRDETIMMADDHDHLIQCGWDGEEDDDISTLDGEDEATMGGDDLSRTSHGLSSSRGNKGMSSSSRSHTAAAPRLGGLRGGMSERGISGANKQPTVAAAAVTPRMPRAARGWSSLRGFGRLGGGGDNKKGRARELPARQGTFDTTRTSDSNNTNGAAAAAASDLALAWEEERTELEEKIEALELKLKTKEACLQSMMIANASKGSTMAVASNNNNQQQQLSALVVKDQEIEQLETKVKRQGMLLEQLESQQCQTEAEQQRKIQEQAEHMFEEWQQRQQDPSLWEQLQEQSELISRLQADADYHRQQQQRERRELEDVIHKLRNGKQEQQSAPAPRIVDAPKRTEELQASNDFLQKQNEALQMSLAQSQQDADGYKTQVQNLMKVVHKMEQDKQDEIQLLNIVMSQLEGIKQEYGLDV